jgi:hypothetical protein
VDSAVVCPAFINEGKFMKKDLVMNARSSMQLLSQNECLEAYRRGTFEDLDDESIVC